MGKAGDKVAIQELLTRYAEIIGAREPARFAQEIFTEDAELDYGTGPVVGSAAIDALFGAFFDRPNHEVNLMANFSIDLHGDMATARSRALTFHWFADTALLGPMRGADLIAVSAYEDELRRTEAGWRIARRFVYNLGPGGVAAGRVPEHWVALWLGLDRSRSSSRSA